MASVMPYLIFHLSTEYNAPRHRPSGMLVTCFDRVVAVMWSVLICMKNIEHKTLRGGLAMVASGLLGNCPVPSGPD